MKTITTLLAALALVALAAACTSELEAGIEGRTITVDLGTKPAYTDDTTDNPNTRTNHTTGQWEVGDKVEVTISFLNAGFSLGTQKQTLTCTAAAPAKWSAAPAIIIAPAKAAEVQVFYNYTSAPDPRTGTKEEISYTTGFLDLPPTGTLAMTAPSRWIRRSSLMVVKNIPDGSTAEIGSAQWKNNTGAPASANFHLPNAGTFTLKIDGNATTMEYRMGKKYTLDARAIGIPDTGGGDVQYINVDGSKSATDIAAIFNSAASTNFCITGTGTMYVREALNNTALVTGTKKINLTMPDVTTEVGTSIFESCGALATISLPSATTIGYGAFAKCDALTTISLPAATSIGSYAFFECTALTRLELTQSATAITVDKDAFKSLTNLTLVLHSTAQNQGNAMGITVNDKAVTFANTADGGADDVTITVGAVEFAN